jgi:hypothetical protein
MCIATLSDTDGKGLHVPLLLESLDLVTWNSLLVIATVDNNKTTTKVKYAHYELSDLLAEDELDAKRTTLLA